MWNTLGVAMEQVRRMCNNRRLLVCTASTIVTFILLLVVTIVIVTLTHSKEAGGPGRKWRCTAAGVDPSQQHCEEFGCHYSKDSHDACTYPTENFHYTVENIGHDGTLYLTWTASRVHDAHIRRIAVHVEEMSNEIFRLVFRDPATERYEIPIDVNKFKSRDKSAKLYDIQMAPIGHPFWISVTRKSTKEVIFDTRGTTLIMQDQLLELTAILPTERLYGIAERGAPFRRKMNNVTMPVFAHDNFPSPIGQDINLYSSQPFYMMAEENGNAHGVMLYNSNAMEVYLTEIPSITIRTLGGIFDMYFLLGPEPLIVTQQLTDLIGKPFMPPYWSLGFHLCRYGYKSMNETKETFERNWNKGLPMDVQWQDIDYMDEKRIFTINETSYAGLKDFVNNTIHKEGVHYVIIVDPAVKLEDQFSVYERGLFHDVYIKNSTDQDIIGMVWPGETVFPDFTKQKTRDWWKEEVVQFHDELPFDGIWLDMNEPASFDYHGTHGSIYGCPNNTINFPPFKPNTAGDTMFFKTLCMDAKQEWGLHRDVHNLYGLTETIATFDSLRTLFPTGRPFIISRSTFLGSGKYAGHWLGDNESNWKHLRQSIAGILDFNMLGIPMTGADIGGFHGDITEELAIRWHQLGAWYPFCRNHNGIDSIDQDPAVFSEEAFEMIKHAIEMRYDLLPTLYTMFYDAHITGKPIIRATFQNFPLDDIASDKNFDEDYTQFMVGENILVAPVVEEGVSSTNVYLPTSVTWYKYQSDTYSSHKSGISVVNVPLGELPYFLKGGSILFKQNSGQTSLQRREKPYEIVLFANRNGNAGGTVYLDDGTTDVDEDLFKFGVVHVKMTPRNVRFHGVNHNGYQFGNVRIERIIVIGIDELVTELEIAGKRVKDGFRFDAESKTLKIDHDELPSFGSTFEIVFV